MPHIVSPARGTIRLEDESNGCFETMRAYEGKIFRLERHLDRLFESAKYLGTRAPADRSKLAKQLTDALKRSKLKEAVVRIALMVRPGTAALPSIVVRSALIPPEEHYKRGISISVVPARSFAVANVDPQAKYSARLGSVLAVIDAQVRGGDEAIFLGPGNSVTESTASNLGIIARGEILTPPCWLGLLWGMTREVLFEIADDVGMSIRETPLTRHDLYNADEVFLTSTLKEVMPVTQVDGRKIAGGRPGPACARLRKAFQDLVRRELKLRK